MLLFVFFAKYYFSCHPIQIKLEVPRSVPLETNLSNTERNIDGLGKTWTTVKYPLIYAACPPRALGSPTEYCSFHQTSV